MSQSGNHGLAIAVVLAVASTFAPIGGVCASVAEISSDRGAETTSDCKSRTNVGQSLPFPTQGAALPLQEGLYVRPETGIAMLGANDGTANSFTEPFRGALGGRYLLFYNGSHVTLKGRGYVLMRWEYAYFNRGGLIDQDEAPSIRPAPGSIAKRVAGAFRFMPDPQLDGVPGQTGLWRPGTQDFTPMTISGPRANVPTGWQDEYYYVDGTVTFANRERGLDYNIALTPVTGAAMRSDVLQTLQGAASHAQRAPLLLDPSDQSPPPAPPAALRAAVASASRVDLNWTDCSAGASGYLVEYSYAGDFGDPGKAKRYGLGDLYSLAGSYPASSRAAAIATLLPSTRYLFRVKAYGAAGDSGYSNVVDVTTPSGEPLPRPYALSDIGADTTSLLTTAVASNGSIALWTTSGDMFGRADSFAFVHASMTGDGKLTARVTGLSAVSPTSKAGVMMRDGLAPDAVYAMTDYQPASGTGAQRRDVVGGTTGRDGGNPRSVGSPWWIRISRKGNSFVMQASVDGRSWDTLSTRVIPMGPTIEAGLALASVGKRVATATFDHVSLTR